MFTPMSSADFVKVPIHIVRSINENEYGMQRGEIIPQEHLKEIKTACDLLDIILPHLKNMSREDALELGNFIKPVLPEYTKNLPYLQKYLAEASSKHDLLLQKLTNKLSAVIAEIIFVGSGKTIDENDTDYSNFLAEMIESACRNEERVSGKEKLFQLFEYR